jgi:hypothetical protein
MGWWKKLFGEKAKSVSAPDPQGRYQLADEQFRNGSFSEALATLEVYAGDPSSHIAATKDHRETSLVCDSILLRAQVLAKLDRHQEAVEGIKGVMRHSPQRQSDHDVRSFFAACLANTRDYDYAKAVLEQLRREQYGQLKPADQRLFQLCEAKLREGVGVSTTGPPTQPQLAQMSPDSGDLGLLVPNLTSFVQEQWAHVHNDPGRTLDRNAFERIFKSMAGLPIQSTASLPAEAIKKDAVSATRAVASMASMLGQSIDQGSQLNIASATSGWLRVHTGTAGMFLVGRTGTNEFRVWFDVENVAIKDRMPGLPGGTTQPGPTQGWKCESCGAPNLDGALDFCMNCGAGR